MSRSDTPPPVSDPNPPRSRRQAPPDDSNAVERHTATTVGTNAGTNVGTPVPGGPPSALSLAALMHGPVDPEQDRGQTGIRLPRYVTDAVRLVAATSRGRLAMQDIVTEAVKAYLPADVLHQAWVQHGGAPEGPVQQ